MSNIPPYYTGHYKSGNPRTLIADEKILKSAIRQYREYVASTPKSQVSRLNDLKIRLADLYEELELRMVDK